MFGKLFDDLSERRDYFSEAEIQDLHNILVANTKIEDFGEGRAAFKCFDCGYSYPRRDCLTELGADNSWPLMQPDAVRRFYEELRKAEQEDPAVPVASVNIAEDACQVCFLCARIRLHDDKYWFTTIATWRSPFT